MIDKTIPNRLQTDADQKYMRPEVGEMFDAQNVTISEDGANTGGVIKNVKGTTAATRPALSAISDDDAVTVIGSVSDPQRGFVYWFVADDVGSTQHAIYRQDTSDNSYELVLKSSVLNFDPNGFVKGDIVNGAFQQDGVLQSALYFTDNRNAPRKINVDRAINTAVYDSGSVDTVISACKPAMQEYVTAEFTSDLDFTENNFRNSTFQFATQLIYIDGEESAISAYSELVFPRQAIFSAMETSGFGVSPFVDNVCEITLPLDTNIPDLEKVRIISRESNDGTFFVVDEFDPDSDLYRTINGENRRIYDASTRVYRFYNNSIGRSVSSVTVNKLYDNVPLLAAGQSVSGNRVMYSNYEEGRPNVDTNNAQFTVTYLDDDADDSGEYINSKGAVISEESTGFEIDIDPITGNSGLAIDTSLPAGTILEMAFDFGLDFKLEGTPPNTDEEPIRFSIDDGNGDSATYYNFNTTDIRFDRKTENQVARVSAVSILAAATSAGSAITSLAANFNDVELRYKVRNGTFVTGDVSIDLLRLKKEGGDEALRYLRTTGSNQYMTVVWGFDGYTTGSGTIAIRPYVKKLKPETAVITDIEGAVEAGESIVAGSDNSILRSGIYTGLSGHSLQGAISYYAITGNNDSNISGYLSAIDASIRSVSFRKTFKSGSSHTFGIVYYDEFNRSGNVNLLGSAYVEPLNSSARTASTRGACEITVDLSNITPPDWATSYQIVYAGSDSYSDFFSYTTSDGYFKRKQDNTNVPDAQNENVYVSLKTLDLYNEQKNTTRTYSFTEGDKLRVVSRHDSGRVYEESDNDAPIEFNVLGTETVDSSFIRSVPSGNTFAYGPPLAYPADDGDGGDLGSTALILEAPQVSSGVDTYDGYDWFEISGTDPSSPSTSVAADATSYWGVGSVVEVLTPRKITSERVFYEIGHGDTISNGAHSTESMVLTNGDTYFRPVACKTATTGAGVGDLDTYIYRTFYLECNTVSDGFDSKDWHKGRAHVVFENSATVRRYNGITYSDAYAEDVANLSLSSFNASLANFYSLDSTKGACNFIGNMKDGYILGLQENGVSRIPVGKDIITSPNQGGTVSITSNVLGEPYYYMGDFGCNNNPESVLVRDGLVFFVDTSRKKVVRLTSEGLSPISQNGVDALFKSEYDNFNAQNGTRIVSGYDPEDNQYYVTLRPTGSYNGFTLGYNISNNTWVSTYTFYPDMYADQNGTMYSGVYVDPTGDDNAIIFHSHDNETAYNTFYGAAAAASRVGVVSNYNPSMVKVFNALSIETDSTNWTVTDVTTDLDTNARTFSLDEREGAMYTAIGGDESTNSTHHIIPIGRVSSHDSGSNSVTFTNRVNVLPLTPGATVMEIDGSNLVNVGNGNTARTFSGITSNRTIVLSGATTIDLDGKDLVLVTDQAQNGDPIRGRWAQITITNNQSTQFELFCVNTHFADSKQNHALGQQ